MASGTRSKSAAQPDIDTPDAETETAAVAALLAQLATAFEKLPAEARAKSAARVRSLFFSADVEEPTVPPVPAAPAAPAASASDHLAARRAFTKDCMHMVFSGQLKELTAWRLTMESHMGSFSTLTAAEMVHLICLHSLPASLREQVLLAAPKTMAELGESLRHALGDDSTFASRSRAFHAHQLKPGDSFAGFHTKFCELYHAIGKPLTPEAIHDAYTRAMPPGADSRCQRIELQPSDDVAATLRKLHATMTEYWREQFSPATAAAAAAVAAVAPPAAAAIDQQALLAALQDPGQRELIAAAAGLTCSYCKKFGHSASVCYQNPDATSQPRGNPRGGRGGRGGRGRSSGTPKQQTTT